MIDSEYPYIGFNTKESQSLSDEHCTRCCLCDKVFHVDIMEDYVYKLNNTKGRQRVLCSWTCYRKAQKIRKGELKYKERHI